MYDPVSYFHTFKNVISPSSKMPAALMLIGRSVRSVRIIKINLNRLFLVTQFDLNAS